MLSVGDIVLHYVDEIEGYSTFQITAIGDLNRCTLKGLDTPTTLSRVLDNTKPSKFFQYTELPRDSIQTSYRGGFVCS